MDANHAKEALGQICWLEIPVRDAFRAKRFYSEIFGWKCDPIEKPAVGDCIKGMHFFEMGKTLHGAFLQVDEKDHVINHLADRKAAMPVLPSLAVEDCGPMLEKITLLGGKTKIPKTEIGGGMGFFARFVDSEGNLVGMWSPT